MFHHAKNNKYIITGAPGTGKTSIINELLKRGHCCIKENSREIIENELKNNGDILPWKNQMAFENKVCILRINKLINSPSEKTCFFDRGVFDSVAYLSANNIKPSKTIQSCLKKSYYNTNVFLTPFWKEIYHNDNERLEDIKMAINIEFHLINTYKRYGFNLVKIPKHSINKRADFILQNIRH